MLASIELFEFWLIEDDWLVYIFGEQKRDTRVICSITPVLDCDEIGGVGKLIKSVINMLEIRFSKFGCLLCHNRPAIKDCKFVRIWNHFPTWIGISKKKKTCTYSIF